MFVSFAERAVVIPAGVRFSEPEYGPPLLARSP
jgi:hypothetical protein